MPDSCENWVAEPLIWGTGDRLLEIFLEPTCPFSARAFDKLDPLLEQSAGKLQVRLWLHSQPWHLFSGIVCRAIAAASTLPDGKSAAKTVMAAIYARRHDFEFDDHRTGPNLETTPDALIQRIEEASGIEIAAAFQIPGLEAVVKQHTRYARQNGIHTSPSFMVDGLVEPGISSGDSVEQWRMKIIA